MPEPSRPAAPFARAPIQWGRPPQVVFQAGPLPRGERLDPLPEPPKAPVPRPIVRPAPGFGGSIHSGSMIPRARPAPATGPVPTPAAPRPVAAPLPDIAPTPRPPVEPIAAATPTFAPPPRLDSLPEPEPTVVKSPIFKTTDAVADVVPERATERVVVTRHASSRMPLYAGIAAVAVIGVASAVWFATRPDTASVPATPAPTVPLDAAVPVPFPAASAPVAEAVPIEAVPAPVVPARTPTPAATTERPVTSPTPRPAPAPTVQAPPSPPSPTPQSEPPAPVIVVAPLAPAGPPPTVAQAPQVDPDAPIVTRPQPLE